MEKMFCEDAYCLGLLYSHIYAGRNKVLLSDLKKFHEAIEANLEKHDVCDIYATIWYDNEPAIYYSSKDKDGHVYYALYPEFDLDEAKSKYIGCISIKSLVASQQNNALNCIGLEKDFLGRIKTKKAKMSDAHDFMDSFILKLKSGELKIEKCSDEGEVLDNDFIIKELESYQRLLNSEVFKEVTADEYPVKKLISSKKHI